MLGAMTPHESPEPQPTPEPEREPTPARTGSLAPPGAEERAAQAAAELPEPAGGLLDRIRRKLRR
jgi:hypothetical protein